MKKTLLALAVLAASGASFAQSSVTLYGRVDANITKITDKSVAMTDGSAYGAGSSRLGVKGVEDLGGGLSAGFLIEAGLAADANTGATTLGSRNSYLELNSKLGGLRLGRQLNPALFHTGAYSAFGTDFGLASGAQVLSIEGARYNNSISYFTPVMSGFTAQIITAMKEADTFSVAGVNNTGSAVATNVVGAPVGAVGATKNPISARVNYAVGPVSAGLALTKNGRAGDKLLTQVGASYNFGPVKLLAAFEQDSNQASKNAYSVGLTAPVGAALLRATYGKDVQTTKQQFGFGADYNLSKRTALYGVFAQTKLTGATAVRQITFGVGHNF